MSYQKCPICNGTGIDLNKTIVDFNKTADKCDVCQGKKIISTGTGLPPGNNINSAKKIAKTIDKFGCSGACYCSGRCNQNKKYFLQGNLGSPIQEPDSFMKSTLK